MKNSIALFLSVILYFNLPAQEKVPDMFKNMNMRSIGPAAMSGRVTAIDAREDNPNIIYVGTASGGLWKSESAGTIWEPIFDDQDVIGIGAVCIDPGNPDVIWAGTGEGNPRNSQTSGAGIYKSLDAGRTWSRCGLEKTYTIHRVIVDPRNSDVVYAAAHGSAWGPNADRGVYKSTDGGTSWKKILFVNDSTGCADLVMDPQNPNKLFAAMYQYGRKPYFFESGGKGSGLYSSVDGGKTWKKITDKEGLPEGDLGRIGIAISTSNPKYVYAIVEAKKNALYRSTDGGVKWQLMNDKDVGDRPFYYNEIYVDPLNENHLIYLHSTMGESIDGGKTWKTLLAYYDLHPDHHAFWWSSKDSRLMMEGNDGGFNISRDGGENWVYAGNLPLGQFYHVNYDLDTPYHVYGGLQDNGSWKGPAYVWHQDGIRAEDWQEVLFGDGFDVMPLPGNSRYLYAMSQGGEVYFVDTETGHEEYIKPFHPEGTPLRFNWNAGMAQDPFHATGIYFGSQFLHYSNDSGRNWKIISPDLTTNNPEKLKQNKSGGLTPDQTNAENHCTILCIGPSEKDENIIWVGTDDGQIQVSSDKGKNWTLCTPNIAGMPAGAWVAQIIPGVHNSQEAFAVVNNYRQNDWKPYLFHTQDLGKTWKNLVSENQVKGHCLSFIQDPVEKKLMFVGTEHGLYMSVDGGARWMKWTHDYPSVATQDLKIHPVEHDLIIGTFGRALFVLDDIRPLRAYASQGAEYFNKKIKALDTPVAYMVSMNQPKGERFPGDAHFAGENRSNAARLTYYYQVDEEKKSEKPNDKPNKEGKKKDAVKQPENASSTASFEVKNDKKEKGDKKDKKVSIDILSLQGDSIRSFKHEPDTGINVVRWRFDSNGISFPSSQERKKDEKPGGGIAVAPGTYKVVYRFNGIADSSLFEVKADPRIPWDNEGYAVKKNLYSQFRKIVDRAGNASDELIRAKKTIEAVKSAYTNVPDSLKKNMLSNADSLNKKIDDLMTKFYRVGEVKGYVDESDKLNSRLYEASSYISNPHPGNNAEFALRNAEKETEKLIQEVNSFFEKDWMEWRKQVESLPQSIFKEIPKF